MKKGSVEVICGCMFSGKTEELVRRLRRAEYAKQNVAAFKSSLDNRYQADDLATHHGVTFRSTPLDLAAQIPALAADADVVGIDEAQFFKDGLVEVVQDLANAGKRVIVVGLDMDFTGRPFPPMPDLMATADKVLKLNAVCMSCGETATRSQRIVASAETVVVGSDSAYQARCRHCWSPEPVFARTESLQDMEG